MKIVMLALLMAVWPTAASAEWRVARSDHFTIYSEDDGRTLADYAGKVERFDSALRRLRRVEDHPVSPANRVTIFVVRSTSAVRKVLGGDNAWAAGFYRPRAANSVIVTPSLRFAGVDGRGALDPMTVLLHEYTHHFLLENFAAAYPAWFVEGFAEFASAAQFDDNGAVGIGLPAQHRARTLMRPQFLTLSEMLTDDQRTLSKSERPNLYATGWLLTHYLIFSDARKGQLSRYLTAINDGEPRAAAAKAAFGDLNTLDRELDAYMKRKLDYIRIPPSQLTGGKIEIEEVSPGAAAVLPLKMRLKRGVLRPDAAAFAALARTAAAPFPNDLDAQLVLADAEALAGKLDACDTAIARALAAQPNSPDALMARAASMMRRRDEAGAKADWPAIRTAISRANKAEPDSPLPLILYYDSFVAANQPPPKLAVDGLERAFELAPQDGGLRLRLATQLVRDRRFDEARMVLAPLAYAPHVGAQVEAARAMLDRLPMDNSAHTVS
ncbi:hypothetical protein ASG67_00700 [Sphingomonas sp. Leaf339]|uniref:tetratricopeptide repeat protein n=1 Tax=Sphingomonas sp. Leaf339 TaxID=1736343 RepID=UPI0006F7930D|nr:hypothetical protein [Sphingomonas sp. Leaf339]KQU61743.1 hypothetical protein ASG67_00700 [Sphingomonas sp. Leaf339]